LTAASAATLAAPMFDLVESSDDENDGPKNVGERCTSWFVISSIIAHSATCFSHNFRTLECLFLQWASAEGYSAMLSMFALR
jgi:hypothetical protein